MLRIGINLGDIIVDGDDFYGDGVNIASGLEALAEPGGIAVSAIVHESLGNRIARRRLGFDIIGTVPRGFEHPALGSGRASDVPCGLTFCLTPYRKPK